MDVWEREYVCVCVLAGECSPKEAVTTELALTWTYSPNSHHLSALKDLELDT